MVADSIQNGDKAAVQIILQFNYIMVQDAKHTKNDEGIKQAITLKYSFNDNKSLRIDWKFYAQFNSIAIYFISHRCFIDKKYGKQLCGRRGYLGFW